MNFEGELEDLQARSLLTNEKENQTDAIGIGWTVALRGGIRLELTRWLSTLTELQVSYLLLGTEPVKNTFRDLDVRLVSDSIVLLRATFSVRIDL